mgnify:CR=1 FL=1
MKLLFVVLVLCLLCGSEHKHSQKMMVPALLLTLAALLVFPGVMEGADDDDDGTCPWYEFTCWFDDDPDATGLFDSECLCNKPSPTTPPPNTTTPPPNTTTQVSPTTKTPKTPITLRNYETSVHDLCAEQSPSSPATMEWTGEICPNGKNIQWNSMKTNDTDCQWSRSEHSTDSNWLSKWMGSCNASPSEPGLSDLPMTFTEVDTYRNR